MRRNDKKNAGRIAPARDPKTNNCATAAGTSLRKRATP